METGSAQRKRVLMMVAGELGDEMRGPVIRGFELGRAIGESHEVAFAPHGTSRKQLARAARGADAMIAPWVPPFLLGLLGGRPTLTIADLYDPADLEAAFHPDARVGARDERSLASLTRMQLQYADVLLCANSRQRQRLLSGLEDLGRRLEPESVLTVPFGIAPDAPAATGRPLRDLFGQIEADDKLVLWWGSLWRWLDAETAVRAMGELASRRPDVKLVFSAGPPKGPGVGELEATEPARRLARELGLLDRSVLFLDRWIPYGERHEYLAEAAAGITLHASPEEADLAARARYLDYLWCGVPCVLSRGDELGEEFAREGFAELVPAGDAAAIAAAVEALVDDGPRRERALGAAEGLRRGQSWEECVRPLADLISRRAGRSSSRGGAARRWAAVAAFYARRAIP